MKRLGLLFTLSTLSLSALPLGNPSDPLYSSRFRVGYYGDYVNQIAMSEKMNNRVSTSGLQFTMNCFKRLDLFCMGGLSTFRLRPDTVLGIRKDEEYANQFFSLEATSTPGYSIGARSALFNIGNLFFGAETQYFKMIPKAKMTPRRVKSWNDHWGEWDVPYHVWQIGGATAYQLGKFFTPYTGLKWQWAKYDFSEVPTAEVISPGFTFADVENVHHLAYTLGISIANQEKFCFSIETTMLNEKSVGLTAQYKF